MTQKNTRQLWLDKVVGNLKSDPIQNENIPSYKNSFSGIVLGIDPSLRGTGLAVLEYHKGNNTKLLYVHTLRIKKTETFSNCLGEIFSAVTEVLKNFPIKHVAIEQTIYVQNFQTAQILGAARGAAMAASAVAGFEVFEYPPLRIKQAVVGYGRASKEQMIQQMRGLLNLSKDITTDEADAAATALCHSLTYKG